MKKNVHLESARAISNLLDNKFNIFGFKFGLDPIIGLIPGIGDFIPLVLGLYMVWIGLRMDLPNHKITEMLRNITIDTVVGFIPLIGDLSDFVFRAHHKNMLILEQHNEDTVRIYEGEIINK